MCPSGIVAMKSRRSASSPELFTIKLCCFDTVEVSSMCFSKTQGSTDTDCNLKPGQLFVDACHLGMGGGPNRTKESSNGSPLFPKPIPVGRFQTHILPQVSTRRLSFPGWVLSPKQQSYRQALHHPGDAGIVIPHFPDEETEVKQRPSYG